ASCWRRLISECKGTHKGTNLSQTTAVVWSVFCHLWATSLPPVDRLRRVRGGVEVCSDPSSLRARSVFLFSSSFCRKRFAAMSMGSDKGFEMQNPLFLQQPNGGGDSDAEVATGNDDSGRRRRRPGTRGNGILQPGGVGISSSSHGSAERERRPRGEALAAIGEGRGQAERVCSDDDGGGSFASSRSVTKPASHHRRRSRSRSRRSRDEEVGAEQEQCLPPG
ncbi:unnamed protein product, partial [Ectocarpus sp. 12 AP-2014]